MVIILLTVPSAISLAAVAVWCACGVELERARAVALWSGGGDRCVP